LTAPSQASANASTHIPSKPAAWRVCVDIGGTKVAVSLMRDTPDAPAAAGVPSPERLLARRSEPTAKSGAPEALAQQVLRLTDAALASVGAERSDVLAVGVSSCGPFVLIEDGIALAAPNICGGLAGPARGLPNDWMHAPLEGPLKAVFPQVRVVNDAIGALQAERRWGALQGLDHCAYLTWSTGIGVGLCVDGVVLRGKHGNAGHAGHMFVSDNADALCGCGNVGDLEGLVAGNAIERRFGRGAAALLQAARDGEAQAQAVVDALCRDMGRALYNLIVTLDLQAISLGGSVFWHHHEFLLPKLAAHIDGKLPSLTQGCRLLPAGLGQHVGDFAAAAVAA
jgi:glucokinase